MELRRISAVDHHPLDLRAAHSNVPEHAVIECVKLAYRRDACASEVVGAPPFAGRGDDRLGQGADDGRSATGSGLRRAQAGAAEVVWRLRARRLGAAPHRLIHCKVCKRSLAPTDKEYILKYFLISRKQVAKQRV